MDIDLKDAVCVLDEAHNIEDVLRESGSGKFTFLELCELSKLLNTYSSMQKSSSTRMNESENPSDSEEMHITDVAHQLLLFVEKWIQWLINSRQKFERDEGKKEDGFILESVLFMYQSTDLTLCNPLV